MSALNPTFDDDNEEEEDFNPEAEVPSDAEDDSTTRAKAARRPSPPADDDEEDAEASAPARAGSNDQADGEPDNEVNDDAEGDQDEEAPAGDDAEQPNNDDDEEDEDEDEDEEEVQGHRQKRRRRDRRNQFIDVEAEVDEDEDEVEEDEDELPEGFVADIHPDDEGLAGAADIDDRRHRELDRRRQEQEDLNAEEQAALFRERYSRYGRNGAVAVDSAVVPQRLLLPSVEDPTIWGVRCKPGKEKEVVFAILKRVEERQHTDPVAIFSAFERSPSIQGYVYIEARKQFDVENAAENIINCYVRTNKVLVPINEMPDLLRTRKTDVPQPGKFCRIKRGKYTGDLAQIEEVESNGLEVDLRIVPRLDYGLNEDLNAPMMADTTMGAAAKRKRVNGAFGKNNMAMRPPAKLFNDMQAKIKHSKFLQQVSSYEKKHFTYLGDTYVRGFLIKSFKVQHLQFDDIVPTAEESVLFTQEAEDGTEGLDLNALSAAMKSNTSSNNYQPGDMVEVYQGEQRGVSGVARRVHGDIVTMEVKDGGLKGQLIEAPMKTLRKLFRDGDHVKVIGGSKYTDEVGMVTRIKADQVTILCDSNNQEITVFSKDVRAATDSGIVAGGSKFDIYDLVQLE